MVVFARTVNLHKDMRGRFIALQGLHFVSTRLEEWFFGHMLLMLNCFERVVSIFPQAKWLIENRHLNLLLDNLVLDGLDLL